MATLEYSGTLIIGDKIRMMTREGIEVINFAAGGTLDNTPSVIKEATKKAIDEGLGACLTEVAGLPELRRMIAERLATEDHLSVDPESQIIVTVGAKNAILEALQATVGSGEEVLILDPFWPSYKPLVNLVGAVPRFVPMRKDGKFQVDPDLIRRSVTPKSKMIILNTPHNPTGRVFSKKEMEGICEIVKEYGLLVLSDESYKELVFENSQHYSIASFPDMQQRTIIIYSFGKAYTMHGWRLGYAVANEKMIGRMLTIQSNSVSCPTSFAQRGGLAALAEGRKELDQIVQTYKRLRDITVKKLKDINGIFCEAPDFGYTVFPDISNIAPSSDDLAQYLLEKGRVATTPGSAFGRVGEGHLRINFRHEEAYLKKGLKAFEMAIKSYMKRSVVQTVRP